MNAENACARTDGRWIVRSGPRNEGWRVIGGAKAVLRHTI